MSKRFLSIAGAAVLGLAGAGLAMAQDTPASATTTTTTVTKTVQNPDGTYSVIEYPVGKQVIVNLSPTATIPGAKGTATIIRNADGSTINLDLSGLSGDVSNYNLYAVDPAGNVTMLGPVNISNGVATQTFTTPMNKFMLFLSPESNLTAYGPDTNVVLRSTVPSGFAVVPMTESRPKTDAIHAKATTEPGSAYNVPMLGISSFKSNAWNRVKVHFSGPLAGSNAEILVRPRSGQFTEVHANFHHLTRNNLPDGTRIVLWAVAPDNTYTKLGQVIDVTDRNKADIHAETKLQDFGLLVTTETAEGTRPAGTVISTISVTP